MPFIVSGFKSESCTKRAQRFLASGTMRAQRFLASSMLDRNSSSRLQYLRFSPGLSGIFPSMLVMYALKSWFGEGKARSGCGVAILAASALTGIKVAKGAGWSSKFGLWLGPVFRNLLFRRRIKCLSWHSFSCAAHHRSHMPMALKFSITAFLVFHLEASPHDAYSCATTSPSNAHGGGCQLGFSGWRCRSVSVSDDSVSDAASGTACSLRAVLSCQGSSAELSIAAGGNRLDNPARILAVWAVCSSTTACLPASPWCCRACLRSGLELEIRSPDGHAWIAGIRHCKGVLCSDESRMGGSRNIFACEVVQDRV